MARGEPGRTYSIWGFVAAFTLMALAGVATLLVFGSSGGATVQLRTPQTLPEPPATVDPSDPSATEPLDPTASDPTASDPATADSDAGAPPSSVPPTAAPPSTGPAATAPPAVPPSSAPAPTDQAAPAVADVERAEGRTTFRFELPAGTDPGSLESVVAPMTVQLDRDGTSATLRIGCARGAGELLGRVVVVDAADRLTIAAVALAPAGAPPCPSGSAPRRVEIELPQPVAGRTLVVATVGSPVP